MNVTFVTFGCRLNRAEALDLEAKYRAAGHTIVDLDTGTVPDVIILRGCSVTAKAQRDCEKTIAHLRQRFPSADLRLMGCLPQARPVGTVPRGSQAKSAGTVPTNLSSSVAAGEPVPMTTSRAYLKIQDGCSGKCAFCIVPTFRGPPRSVPFQEVLARARAFLVAGYHELVVTGCNLALYKSEGHTLSSLLSALAEIRPTAGTVPLHPTTGTVPLHLGTVPTHRIRLGSLEPGICDEQILDVIEEHPNICRFLHLSLQSGSDAVLRRMNRPYTRAHVDAFCTEAFRRLGPRLALGADVIAGFPGETDADHELTKHLLANSFDPTASSPTSFTHLHVFPYSERPGTPAATLDGALPRAVRLARAKELTALGKENLRLVAQSFIGQTVEVCVERGNDHGWTAEYLPCRLATPAPRRSLVTVQVKSVDDNGDLIA